MAGHTSHQLHLLAEQYAVESVLNTQPTRGTGTARLDVCLQCPAGLCALEMTQMKTKLRHCRVGLCLRTTRSSHEKNSRLRFRHSPSWAPTSSRLRIALLQKSDQETQALLPSYAGRTIISESFQTRRRPWHGRSCKEQRQAPRESWTFLASSVSRPLARPCPVFDSYGPGIPLPDTHKG